MHGIGSSTIGAWVVTYRKEEVRRETSKSLQIINAGEDAEKRKFSYTVGRNVNW